MRHLVAVFSGWGLSSLLALGCSLSTVGSMDPVEGGKCTKVDEQKQAADQCTQCTCDGTTWSCDSSACMQAGSGGTGMDTGGSGGKGGTGGTGMGTGGSVPGGAGTGGTGTSTGGTGMGTGGTTPTAGTGNMPVECTPGDTKLRDDGCARCACDDSGSWVCPDVACIKCTPGEMATDSCKSCTCDQSGNYWSCTGFVDGRCSSDACTPGSTVPAGDGCNTCTCQADGTLACTLIDCNPGAIVCASGLADCDGDSANGCETILLGSTQNCGGCGIVCMAPTNQQARCVAGACTLEASCLYEGVEHALGSSFPSRDGCNTCECGAAIGGASVTCTEKACACDPLGEQSYRSYLAYISDCATDYPCASGATKFENECGCGCEQSEMCPDEFDCTPSGTMNGLCDPTLRALCPITPVHDGGMMP